MDLIVSPANVVALNPQQGAALPALRTGEVVEAQVLQAVADAAQIAIGNTILEVQTQIALTPGTTVKLAVSNSPQGLRLTLVGGAGGTGAAVGGSVRQRKCAATAGLGTSGVVTVPADSVETPAVITTPAGAPQGAPAAVTANGNPLADPAAIAGDCAANNTAGATSTNVAAATTADAQIQPSAQAPNPVVAATAALTAAVQTSAARQGGLGPLFADASVAATIPAVPEPVRQAAERLLALPPVLDDSISADDVKQALDRSGLFLEANLSAEVNGGSAAPASADDLKAALVVLRNVVKSWLATDLPTMSESNGATGTSGALGRMAAQLSEDSGGSNGQGTQAAQNGARAQNLANPPPPPYRGAPTAGQPATAPSISADMAPRDIGKVLLSETDAALARQTLLQAASLPDHMAASLANGSAVRNDPSGPRWLFEVPFATPQGPAVAQFEIARDGHNTPAAPTAVAWRARFSLDVEPIGPVHAQIALTGSRAAVTLWAERPETSAKLRDNAPELANALRQAELDPGDVLVRAGSPPRPREAAPSGRFLDRAS